MQKVLFTILLFFLADTYGFCQVKQTESEEQIWLGYFNQARFSKRWGIWTDVALRTKENFVDRYSQAFIRPGLTYYLTDDVKLTLGYTYAWHFPGDNHKNVTMPEHRPWQQIQWHTKYPKVKLMQWFRLEERFRRNIKNDDELAGGYNFNWRIRYNILAQFPLSKKRFATNTVSLVTANEVFVNFGKRIVYNYFDQNRFFAGFHYHLNKHDNLQFGYMNVFQQLAAGNWYRNVNTLRLFYFHNLDLRKHN
ncbi:MAG: DUF2490 domain-containing protein [Chitinophagaceae bacterium]|jgi:hypothetical protein